MGREEQSRICRRVTIVFWLDCNAVTAGVPKQTVCCSRLYKSLFHEYLGFSISPSRLHPQAVSYGRVVAAQVPCRHPVCVKGQIQYERSEGLVKGRPLSQDNSG